MRKKMPKIPNKQVAYYEELHEQLNVHGEFDTLNKTTKSVRSLGPEEEYIKVSRYLNTIFAYHGIPQNLVPISLLLAQRMGFKDNLVLLLKSQKEEIAAMLDVKLTRVEQYITQLKKHDVIRPTADRGLYEVNWYLFSTGSNKEIKLHQALFDFEANQVTVLNETTNYITGETVRKAVYNYDPIAKKQIPGQMSIGDFINTKEGRSK